MEPPLVVFLGAPKKWNDTLWVFAKMVGFPNKPMGFPTTRDHFGVWNGGYHHFRKHPSGKTSMAMENGPFEDGIYQERWDCDGLCQFQGG